MEENGRRKGEGEERGGEEAERKGGGEARVRGEERRESRWRGECKTGPLEAISGWSGPA